MSELYTGRRGSLVLALESPRGTKASPEFAVPYNEISFDNKTVKKELGGAYGSIQAVRDNKTVKKYAEGSFSFDLEDKAIGVILAGVFGQLPTTIGSTNYEHTFTPLESNLHQSINAVVQDPNVSGEFALGMVNSMEISVEPEGVVGCSVELRSKAGEDSTEVTPEYDELGNVFIHADASVKVATDTAGLASAVALDITGLTLTVNKNVGDFNDVGSLEDREIVNKDMTVEGNITLGYTDQTFRNYDLSDGEKAIQISFTKDSDNSLVFTIPVATFEGWGPNKPLDDIVTQQVTFKAIWNAEDFFTAVLKNQVADYLTDES